ncbi:MAG: hypothetical protein LLG04_10420 [Parachlamydia sp.]|nr:hypothetical protein [Parachlamydia sp.]
MRFVIIVLLSLHLNCYGSMMWDSYQWYQFDWAEREKRFVKTLEHIEKSNADSYRKILLIILSIDGEVLLDFMREKIKICESGDDELKQHIPVYQRIVQQIQEIMGFMRNVYG